MISNLKKNLPNSYARGLKKIFLYLRAIYYTGNSCECNICNRKFRKMLPGGFNLPIIGEKEIIGAGPRNHICPYCQSTDRDRFVKLFFDNRPELLNDKIKMLHIAPEPGLYRFFSSFEDVDYIPAAKYHEGIYYPSEMTLVDLTDMHYSDSEFDIIIANHVLEHIPKDKLALSEIYRTLRKGGIAILQVPYSNNTDFTYENTNLKTVKQREDNYGQFDHVRLYGKDYPELLESAGFKVKCIKQEDLDSVLVGRLRLFPEEILFTAEKTN
jgi:SAM-dependent methyltransferase